MVTVPELGAELRRIADTWGVEEAYCDPSQPKTIEAFRARGVDAMGADNSVFEGISKVQAVLPKLYISSQCRNTLEEMGQYKWLEGNVGYKDKPMKVHDHAMDALRYAVSGLVYGTMQVKARGYQYV
jgi:phage terminase large subunit